MNLGFDLQELARNSPIVFGGVWKLRNSLGLTPRQSRRVVERGDVAVIDGYPRSANTFACDAFVMAQGGQLDFTRAEGYPIRIGQHFHSPAQFALARKFDVPAMLLIREPVAAALSWVIYNDGRLTAEQALRSYVRFHKPLIAIADSFVAVPFEEATANFGKSIERLNARFDTQFKAFDHTPEAQKHIFAAMARRQAEPRAVNKPVNKTLRSNYPDDEKRRKQVEFAAQFEDSRVDGLKREASALYHALTASL